jgi:predicted RNA-binding protein YlxR (DUF448 family)
METERPAPALTGNRDVTEAEHDGTGPTRTCVGCRGRGDRSVLLRLVVSKDAGRSVVVLDPRRRMPGRGAWLHPDTHCLELASRRSALARSLRRAGPVDTTTVLAQLRSLLQDDGAAPHSTTDAVSDRSEEAER